MRRCTLCDLPTELKVLILSQLGYEPGSRHAIRSCSRVCACLRAVAVEFLFNTHLASTVSDPKEVLEFLDKHPRVCAKLLRVRIAGRNADVPLVPSCTTIDYALLDRLVALAPRMDYLTLCNLRIDAASSSTRPRHQGGDHPLTRPLEELTVQISEPGSSVEGVLRILSLFKVEYCSLEAPLPFIPYSVASSASLRPLHHTFGVHRLSISSCGAEILDGLARMLIPDTLEHLRVKCNSPEAIRATGSLLKEAGQSLKSLTISPGLHSCRSAPLQDDLHAWEALDLSACPHLEGLTLTLPLSPSRTGPHTRAPCARTHPGAALTSILARAPTMLRVLVLTITGIEHTAPLVSRDLAGADAALARLPGLEHVVCALELPCADAQCPCTSDGDEQDCAERYAGVLFDALPGARQRRVLEVRTVTS